MKKERWRKEWKKAEEKRKEKEEKGGEEERPKEGRKLDLASKSGERNENEFNKMIIRL